MAFHRYPQLIRSVCNLNQFGPSRAITRAAAWPWVAHTVSGLPGATLALFTLGFPVAPAVAALTGPRLVTRRVILQKARDHRDTEVSYGSHCVDAVGFRLSFTPLAGVLFTVPSRYCALSVTTSSSPWTVVGPASHRISRVRWYSRWLRPILHQAIRDCHPLWCGVPATSGIVQDPGARKAVLAGGLTTPLPQRLLAWHGNGLGNGPFRSPLLRAWFYLLRLLRCFSSPGSRPHPYG